MLGVNVHLDEFTLLRLAARDLSVRELGSAEDHLSTCETCGRALEDIRTLDVELRRLAEAGDLGGSADTPFAADDPFRSRPVPRPRPPGAEDAGRATLEASERGMELQTEILEAAKSPAALGARLAELSPERTDHRLGVLYALQEASRRSAEDPFAGMRLAEEALRWLRQRPGSNVETEDASVERTVPRAALRAQANMLRGIGRLWTKEYAKAQRHFAVAYRLFARAGADLTSFAVVELGEAQRRALASEGPASALAIVRRARETFEELGLGDYVARAMAIEGLALDSLGRREEAVESCRGALALFERYELWAAYVGTLNCEATFLIKLGRVDEARREFARALRRFSAEQHRYSLGYIRIGLAEALFAAGHYSEAAVAAGRAARVFAECSLRAHTLIAMLLEVECWARSGSIERARRRLDLFWAEIDRDGALDAVVIEELAGALSGADPNYEKLASLRSQLSDVIQERYRAG